MFYPQFFCTLEFNGGYDATIVFDTLAMSWMPESTTDLYSKTLICSSFFKEKQRGRLKGYLFKPMQKLVQSIKAIYVQYKKQNSRH